MDIAQHSTALSLGYCCSSIYSISGYMVSLLIIGTLCLPVDVWDDEGEDEDEDA